jgi:flavin reductase (DIM6/NTAB) family NADH-FMN oxidoreductase RutF
MRESLSQVFQREDKLVVKLVCFEQEKFDDPRVYINISNHKYSVTAVLDVYELVLNIVPEKFSSQKIITAPKLSRTPNKILHSPGSVEPRGAE